MLRSAATLTTGGLSAIRGVNEARTPGAPGQLVPKANRLLEEEVTFLKRKLQERREFMRTAQIQLNEYMDVATTGGVPEEHIKERRARIYRPPKNAMQSGTNDTHNWVLDFEQRERWENPTMGWGSTGDPMSNLKLKFIEREDAVAFCDKNGWTYFVEEDRPRKPLSKSYAANFAWNKRTRVGTK